MCNRETYEGFVSQTECSECIFNVCLSGTRPSTHCPLSRLPQSLRAFIDCPLFLWWNVSKLYFLPSTTTPHFQLTFFRSGHVQWYFCTCVPFNSNPPPKGRVQEQKFDWDCIQCFVILSLTLLISKYGELQAEEPEQTAVEIIYPECLAGFVARWEWQGALLLFSDSDWVLLMIFW